MKCIIRFFTIIACCAVACAVSSCHNDEPGDPVSDTSRTVLVYIVATNNLGSSGFDSADILEMEQAIKAGDLAGGRWLVYRAAADGSAPTLTEYTVDGNSILKTYEPGALSVTAARMNEVFDDMKSMAPSDTYGLVLWSHASGWQQDGLADNFDKVRPLSYGSDFGKKMNVTTLASVLEGRGFDYVYFDCCYMSTVEVAYELRHAVKYVVASPSELPTPGTRYDLNMRHLVDGSESALIKAAANTFEHYNSLPSAIDRTCPRGVIRTHRLDELAAATAAIYDLTPLPHPGENVTNYRSRYSRQGKSIDFGEYVSALAAAGKLDAALVNRFNKAIDAVVPYKAATEMIWDEYPVYSTSGLATYVFNNPDDYDVNGYPSLQWAADVVGSHHVR